MNGDAATGQDSTNGGPLLAIRQCIDGIVKSRDTEDDKYIVRLHKAVIETDEIMAALDPMLRDRVTMGQKVKEFEAKFSKQLGLPGPVMSNSGSSANLLGLAALCSPAVGALKAGDEVILPALLWSTTIWPVIQLGLVPVIVDIDPDTLNIDPSKIESALSSKTKGIMIVHIMGNPCNMSEVMAIAEKHSLVVIEDCCEALGSTYKGKKVGSFGKVASFSFYYSHHITTIEGGMNVTSDPEVADRMKIMRAHGWSRDSIHQAQYNKENPDIDQRWLFVDLGYNFRSTEINASMGLVQLDRVSHVVGERQRNGDFLREKLKPLEKHLSFQQTTPGGTHPWFYFCIIVRKSAPFTRNAMIDHMEANKIETRPLLTGNILRQPAMKFLPYRVGSKNSDLEVADWITTHGFAIGVHSEMTDFMKQHILDTISSFVSAFP